MRSRAPRIVAAAMIAALFSGACGGDRLTKEEFIAAADQICAEAEEKIKELERPTNPANIDAFVDEAIELTEGTLEELRDLKPPELDEDRLNQMFDAIEDAIDQLPSLAEAAQSEDTSAIQEASQEVQEATQTSQEIASEYGFEKCGAVSPTGAPAN